MPSLLRHQPDVIVVLVTLLAAPLFLYGLGQTYLWQDEAQTALLARSVLRHGLPMVGEGPESLSAVNGHDAGIGGVYFQVPWLQAYVAAASLGVLGESSRAARLPFALAGWLCVPLIAWAMRRAGASLAAARLAAVLTALSVPFVVASRQARYYALATAATLLVAGTYAALARHLRERPEQSAATTAFAFGACACLLVLAFDLTAIGVLGALAVHWLTTIRRPPRWDRRFWIPYGAAGLLLATWIGFALTASSRQNVGHLSARLLAGFPYYLGQIDAYVLPLPYLLTLGALLIGRPTVGSTAGAPRGHDTPAGADAGGNHADGRRAAFLLAFVVLGGLAGASLAPSRWMRYVFCVVPVVLGLAAQGLVALAEGRRWGRWVAAVLVLAMVSSSVPFVLSHALLATLARASGAITVRDRTVDYRVPLWQLFQEFRDPPHGPVAAVVAYLREHARPGDAIVATYGELPLKFHTTLEVWGGETGQLPPPHVSVEWIWQRDFAGPLYDQVRDSVDWVDRQLAQGAYHRIELPAIDRRWENREDPSVHIFSNPGPDGPPVILHAPRQPPRP